MKVCLLPAVRRTAWLLVTASLMVGCAAPAVIYRPVNETLAEERGQLEVLLTSGERYVIANGRVQNDTLHAVLVDEVMTGDAHRLAVPMARVASISRTERGITAAGAGTVGLTMGVFLGALAIVGLAMATAR